MNNAKIAIDNVPLELEEGRDIKPVMREREAELVRIVEALGRVEGSVDWKTLEKLVFGGIVESLERRRKTEAEKPEINAPELYRLQGQLVWAKKFSNLEDLTKAFKVELTNIRKQLHG